MTNIQDDDTDLLILHRNPQYANDCMEILNAEWPRSKGLRLRSLNSSCDQFPTSLALLRSTSNSENQEVIGHARVNILPREENAAWIESVVIRGDLRGKGYGRILMTKTEEFAKAYGFTSAYLSTHDKQKFYSKLGYNFCPPVCIYGGAVNRNIIPKQILLMQHSPDSVKSICKASELCKKLSEGCNVSKKETSIKSDKEATVNGCLASPIKKTVPSPPAPPPPVSGPPPPPPPPPPLIKTTKNDIQKLDINASVKMYMKKSLID